MSQSLHMPSRSGEVTMSLSWRTGGRLAVSVVPADPLTEGYDDAGLILEPEQVRRLRVWLTTGEALPSDGAA